jgi:hypothetical protein
MILRSGSLAAKSRHDPRSIASRPHEFQQKVGTTLAAETREVLSLKVQISIARTSLTEVGHWFDLTVVLSGKPKIEKRQFLRQPFDAIELNDI